MSVRIFQDVATRQLTVEQGAQALLDERNRQRWLTRIAKRALAWFFVTVWGLGRWFDRVARKREGRQLADQAAEILAANKRRNEKPNAKERQ
jgi:cell division protein FtsB